METENNKQLIDSGKYSLTGKRIFYPRYIGNQYIIDLSRDVDPEDLVSDTHTRLTVRSQNKENGTGGDIVESFRYGVLEIT